MANVDLIADFFIWKGQTTNRPISNKKLQKLIYYAKAWSLVINGPPLFTDKIEAWVHGPAVRKIYFKYKSFGFLPIIKETDEPKLEPSVKTILNEVWKVYGKFDASYLELLTHSELPWQAARQNLTSSETSNNEISRKVMKNFYSERFKAAQ